MFALLLTAGDQAIARRQALPAAQCEELLAGVARGEREAFEALYRATDKMLYAYALSLTGRHHDAQDVMMETYLKIRAAAHLYQDKGKPLAWIFTIAKNIVRSHYRTAGRELPFAEVEGPELAFDPSDRSDEAVVLRAALRTLSEVELQIVVLHAVSGLKHRELAALLGLPLSTVLSKYSRAIGKLKRHLTREEETGHDGT